MKYRIIGTTIPAVEIKFDAPGETMYTQSGGMSWMSEGISMSTNTRGGFMKGLGRMFAGESMFMATYRADAPGATIAFASTRKLREALAVPCRLLLNPDCRLAEKRQSL